MAKSKEKRKNEYVLRYNKGQFFTSEELVSLIEDKFNLSFDGKYVLEPSCGSCVFINKILSKYDCKFDAYDIDSKLIRENKKKYPNVNFFNNDFLLTTINKKYDIVIGNPPFNLKTTANYYDTTEGFVLKSLNLLKQNGDMVLVLPSTVLRNKQYEFLRKQIIINYKIVGIINSSKYEFLGADIETIVLYLKKIKCDHQSYYYYDNGNEKLIEWENNKRYTIHTDTLKSAEQIQERLSNVSLSDLFEIHRGKGGSGAKLKGRNINFYGTYLEGNGNKYYIGIQNVAYRFTANVIKGEETEISDTITLLVPKKEMSLVDLFYYSEYLNSSIANYMLHSRVLNNCRLTIHMDKYFIDDIMLPNDDIKEKVLKNVIVNENEVEFAKKRNDLFEEIINDNGLLIDIKTYWSFPKYKEKSKYSNPLKGVQFA